MPSDPTTASGVPPAQPTPAPSVIPPGHAARALAPGEPPDADAAEPVPHERPPVRSDDN